MTDDIEGGLIYKGARFDPWVPVPGERVRFRLGSNWWKNGLRSGEVVAGPFSSIVDGRDVHFVRVSLDNWSSRRREVTTRVDDLMKAT